MNEQQLFADQHRSNFDTLIRDGAPWMFQEYAPGQEIGLSREQARDLQVRRGNMYGMNCVSFVEPQSLYSPSRQRNTLRPSNVVTSDSASSAQSLVQETIYEGIIDHLMAYGGVLPFVKMFRTGTGGQWKYPGRNATSQMGQIITTQATSLTELDIGTITEVVFEAYTYSSRPILISRETIQDSVFDIVNYVEDEARRRIGRIMNAHFTTGTGTNQPLGLVNSAKAGVTAASTTAITYAELVNLIYSIDNAYRSRGERGPGGFQSMGDGMTGFMISDGAEQAIRRLADSEGRPLWIPSVMAGLPNTILGYPYIVNDNMDSPAAGTVPVLFGDFGYYGVRMVTEVEIFRFMDSNTAIQNAIMVIAYARADGRPIGAVTGNLCQAYAKLTQAAA